jgi:hypothetical protein
MKTLYFDIDGTVLLLDTDRAKLALGGGMLEAAVRRAGFEKLVCVGNFAHAARLLKAMDSNYDEIDVLFRLCDGTFTDEDWFRSVTAMVSDPDNRGRHIDLTDDWWYVDDLAAQFLVQAGRQDVLQAQRGRRAFVPDAYGHGQDILQWLKGQAAQV